jgi:hypothetical protein
MVVFYRAETLSPTLCCRSSSSPSRFYGWWHWWRGVRQEGEVRVVPLSLRNLILRSRPRRRLAASAGNRSLWHLHAALPHLDATLMSYSARRQLVAGAQAHRQLVALDRRGSRLHRRVHLQGSLASRRCSTRVFVGLAVLGLRDWRRAAENPPVSSHPVPAPTLPYTAA